MNYRMKTKDYALSSFTIEKKSLQIVSPRHIQIVSREEVKNSNYIDMQKAPPRSLEQEGQTVFIERAKQTCQIDRQPCLRRWYINSKSAVFH